MRIRLGINMFEEPKFVRLALLEKYAPAIVAKFAELLNAPASSRFEARSRLSTLSVKAINDYAIEASYVGTTIHFQLSLTYSDKDKTIGRVVCLHKYMALEKVRFDILGNFTFDPAGSTDLPLDNDGETRTLANSHGDIVMHFLDEAIAAGAQEFA